MIVSDKHIENLKNKRNKIILIEIHYEDDQLHRYHFHKKMQKILLVHAIQYDII